MLSPTTAQSLLERVENRADWEYCEIQWALVSSAEENVLAFLDGRELPKPVALWIALLATAPR